MAKDGNKKYIDALSHAEDSEFDDQLMDILRKRSDFPVLARRSLFGSALFWIVIISTNLAIALVIVLALAR